MWLTVHHFLRALFGTNYRKFTRRQHVAIFRPRLEALEDRCVPSAGWAVSNGGTATFGTFQTISAADAAGDHYVTGYFSGTATFGSTTLNASTESSYVAKVDPNGNFLWATQIGGLASSTFPAIAADSSGNVYVAGNFAGTASFGSTTLTSDGGTNSDIYICKLDTNGNVLWARQAGGSSSDDPTAIAVDSSGNVYVTGQFDHGGSSVVSATFGSTTLTATCSNVQGIAPAFLSKLDGNGNFLWSEQLLGGIYAGPINMAGDSSGNMYIVGGANNFQGSGGSGFMEKVDTNGNVVWAQGASRPLFADAVFQDPTSGATWLYASIWPTASSPADIEKLDASSGTVLWSEVVGAPSSVAGRAMAVDASGNVYVAGQFSNTLDFDPGPGTAFLSPQGTDVFVVKLDPSGNFLSAHDFGGTTATDTSYGLAVDSSGNIYTAGSFGGTSNFDTGSQTVSLTSPGSTSLFIAKTTQDMGAIFGRVFNDLNDNGVFDPSSSNPETGIPNVTLYLDLNNSGSYVPGDPTATTDASGSYEFNHLTAGSYVIRQMTPSGWRQTYPSAGGANAVTLSTGQFVDTENFGDYTPSQIKSYSSTNVPLKLKTNSGASITSSLTIKDAATIFDLNVSINVTTTSTSLVFLLTAPDGTTVQVQPGTTHVTDLNYHGTQGTWTLKMYNSAPAPKPSTLNSWSLSIDETMS